MSVASLDLFRTRLAKLRDQRLALRQELEQNFQPFAIANDDSERAIKPLREKIEAARGEEKAAIDKDFDPRVFMGDLKGEIPILLFPLRVQTRFSDAPRGGSLQIRVYPDDISVQSHEARLTENEKAVGDLFWSSPKNKIDSETLTQVEIWRGMVEQFGMRRAAWIRQATDPTAQKGPELINAPLRIPAVWTLPERLVFRLYGPGDRLLMPEILGGPIPDGLEMGFDPTRSNMGFVNEKHEDFEYPPELLWQADFSEAEKVGMGISIPLSELGGVRKIERLVVLGVRLSSDEKASKELLEKLIEDHLYSDGFSVVPQGTPTNITEDNDIRSEPAPDDVLDWWQEGGEFRGEDPNDIKYEDEADGLRLAHALGIAPEALRYVRHAGCEDGRESISMKRALWAGTFGYYLQQMLAPLFESPEEARRDRNRGERLLLATRFFFTHFVFGRGPLPAIRVGDQPYGVLPVSGDMLQAAEDRVPEWNESFIDEFTGVLQQKLILLSKAWMELVPKLPVAGASKDPGDDADARLISILGLQPASGEYRSERLAGPEYLRNYLDFRNERKREAALGALEGLRQARFARFRDKFPSLFEAQSRIFDLTFYGAVWTQILAGAEAGANGLSRTLVPPLSGDVIDNLPLSESRVIDSGYPNYIKLLAELPLAEIRKGIQRAGENGKIEPVSALLYMLLRHSYLYEYAFGAMRLHHHLNGTPWNEFREKELYNLYFIFDRTYWDLLETEVNLPQVAAVALPNPTALQVLAGREKYRRELGNNWSLIFGDVDELHRALVHLQDLPTARLERLFAEHVDLAGYRLDAWLTGWVYQRLMAFRAWSEDARGDRIHPLYPGDTEQTLHVFPRTAAAQILRYDLNHRPIEKYSEGIYIGAFGWVEHIEADPTPTPADDLPTELLPKNGGPVTRDPANVGLIHAPSLNQAVTAALLRSASVSQPDKTAFNIDLSSARVREALWIIDGVRNGQAPAALLGYKFERGLRERKPALQQYLPHLRQAFPMPHREETDTAGAESIPAKDVVNGLRIIQARRDKTPGKQLDDFITSFMQDRNDRLIIEELADGLIDALDACADLMLAESAHQAAQGNYERAGGAVTASGEFTHVPAEFEVIDTPRSGTSITHRVLLAFNEESSATPAKTARARLQPQINAWLGAILGPLDKIVCGLTYIFRKDNAVGRASYAVTLDQLGLEPLDLIYVFDRALISELAARLNAATRSSFDAQQPNTQVEGIEVQFFATGKARTRPVGEFLPLLAQLRKLLTNGRPVTQRDLLPPKDLHGLDQEKMDAIDRNELVRRVLGVTAATPGTRATDSLWGGFEAAMKALDSIGGLNADGIREQLLTAAQFGIPEAAPDIAAEPAQLLEALKAQAVRVKGIMQSRLDEAHEKLKARLAPEEKDVKPTPVPKGEILTLCREIAGTLLGTAFPVMPRIAPPAGFSGARLSPSPPKPEHVDDWLFLASNVRENAMQLQHARVLAETTAGGLPPLQVFQWPAAYPSWVADPLPAKGMPVHDFISIVMQPAKAFDAGKPMSGLVIDEWHELIPNENETTGISFHYDAPNAEPPQALLLAVSERRRDQHGQWSWDELVRCIDQSFALAKLRAVGPDELRQTPLDTVLPATVAAEAATPATIATSFLANASVRMAAAYAEAWKKT
ncbi:hypothetical protein [Methylocaldum gracile]|uniref:hypothetical protein n=1 Tax=Methylocaldum sp. 0917 TaxID=2485163 RepID=UPI00105F7BFD